MDMNASSNFSQVTLQSLSMSSHFNLEDASQVLVGAFALAVPISFSEEAWRLGESLPFINLLMLFSLSVLFLGFFRLSKCISKQHQDSYYGIYFSCRDCLFYCRCSCCSGSILHQQIANVYRPNYRS